MDDDGDDGEINEPMAYTVNQAARTMALSRTSIYALVARGDLRDVKVAGRRLILREDILRLLQGGYVID